MYENTFFLKKCIMKNLKLRYCYLFFLITVSNITYSQEDLSKYKINISDKFNNNISVENKSSSSLILDDWLICGPFEKLNGNSSLNENFLNNEPDESNIIPKKNDYSDGKKWTIVKNTELSNNSIVFNDYFNYQEGEVKVAYAYRMINVKKKGHYFLKISHDDGAKVWLNSKSLGSFRIGSNLIPVMLKKGQNHLLAKVENIAAGWLFSAHIIPPIEFSTPIFSPNCDGVNDEVKIILAIEKNLKVSTFIRDSDGDTILTLTHNKEMSPQNNCLFWDGKASNGKLCPPGTYYVTSLREDSISYSGPIELANFPPLKRSFFKEIKEFFPLGVYYVAGYAKSRESFEIDCKDLIAHNMNTISFAHQNFARENTDKPNMILETMDKYGLKAIVTATNPNGFNDGPPSEIHAYNCLMPLVEEANKYSSVLAYYLADEPKLGEQHHLKVSARVLEEIDGVRPGIACLIGLDRMNVFVEEMDAPVTYIDPYAVTYGSDLGDFRMRGFGYPDLDIGEYIDIARNKGRKDSRLWTIIQTHNFQKQLREPTPEEIRAMSWIALAHGSTGLIYFIYQSEQGWKGLIHENKITERYEVVSEVCGIVKKIAPILLRLRYSELKLGSTNDPLVEIQTFTHTNNNKKYLFVINRDVVNRKKITVNIDNPYSVIDIVKEMKLNLKENTVSIMLEPGEGTLLEVLF